MFETLEVTSNGPVGTLALNRPDQLNALSLQTLAELRDAAAWFNAKQEVRVVIVKGHGRAFSVGADLSILAEFSSSEQIDRDMADLGRVMAEAVENMRAITIASIQGWCVGGGLVLAAACDMRIATPITRFSIPEVDLGIPLAWGGVPRLVREIGPALTKELVMTCRQFDAQEAKDAGFLNRIVDEEQLPQATQELADSLSKKPFVALANTKRYVNAISEQMLGSNRAWADADSLIAAAGDPECAASREAYLKGKA
jgi:enoyl-CoA hydratase/3-hydroxypropionyl-coenzyme A dehydratase